MGKEVKKVMVIGLDAPITKRIEKYIKEGELPWMARLVREGTWAENCLPFHPPVTPLNWTTIATGSRPGTHGITCFHLHKPGMELDEVYQAFSSEDPQSEYIWEVGEKIGKRSIILNYPTSWPPKIKKGIQVSGVGVHITDWRVDRNNKGFPSWKYCFSLAEDQLFSTHDYPSADIIEFKPAKDWENLPSGKRPLFSQIKVGCRNCRDKVEPKRWYILLQDTLGKGYDMVSLCRSKDGEDIIFTLREGEWSKKVTEEFVVNGRKKKAFFMGKLIELSPNGEDFRLYLTPFCELSELVYPKGIDKKLEKVEGLPFRGGERYFMDWYNIETYIEGLDLEAQWLGGVASHLLKSYDWEMFFMHAHGPDHCYHAFINKIDPGVCKDKNELKRYQKAELRLYKGLDQMIGKIVECADEKTLVIVVSDHGAIPTEFYYEKDFKEFSVDKLLLKEGLLVYKDSGGKKIDWSKTKAVSQRSVYVYVNLKGRDPQGVVESKDYGKVQDEVINTLYNYTDPKTGKKPVVFALKKEDAQMLGLYGDRIGDVVYGIRGEVNGEHGRQVPTSEYGIGSMKGLLILWGPNIKKGYRLKRIVHLTDLVPTLCYLMQIPVPKDTEGGIIYQALEEPDFWIKEMET